MVRWLMIATVTVAGACGGSSKPVEGIRLASSSAADGGREVRVPIGGDNLGERALRALMFEARRQVPVKRVERTPKTSGGQPRTYTVFQTRHTCENRPRLRNITTYPHREQNNWPQVSWQRLLEPYTDAQIVAPTPEVCVPADGEMHSYLRASIRAH